jgi:hypothetical protein
VNVSGSGALVGRVVGDRRNNAALANNYAFVGMTLNGNLVFSGTGLNTVHGENLTDDNRATVQTWFPNLDLTPFILASGTAANPIAVASQADLQQLSTAAAGTHFRLTQNIALTGTWTPIGNATDRFTGAFDGGGFTISGLNVNVTSGPAGFFGSVGTGGVVENLTIEGYVRGVDGVGGIAGNNHGTIRNCFNSADITGTSAAVGGIVGWNNDGIIENCHNTGTITGQINVGGIVGQTAGNSIVRHCLNVGDVTGTDGMVGGIVGHMNGGTVSNNVALNTDLERNTDNTNVGRIRGGSNGGVLENNHACTNMLINGNTVTTGAGVNTNHGADLPATPDQNWWANTANFDFTNVWVWDGTRPRLRVQTP